MVSLPIKPNHRKTMRPEIYMLDAHDFYVTNVSSTKCAKYEEVAAILIAEINDGQLEKKSDVVTSLANYISPF